LPRFPELKRVSPKQDCSVEFWQNQQEDLASRKSTAPADHWRGTIGPQSESKIAAPAYTGTRRCWYSSHIQAAYPEFAPTPADHRRELLQPAYRYRTRLA